MGNSWGYSEDYGLVPRKWTYPGMSPPEEQRETEQRNMNRRQISTGSHESHHDAHDKTHIAISSSWQPAWKMHVEDAYEVVRSFASSNLKE